MGIFDFLDAICAKKNDYLSSNGEVAIDSDALNLTHVGTAAYDCLRTKHFLSHHKMWNVTSGKVIGEVHQTPKKEVFSSIKKLQSGHDDWFPKKMGEILSRTEVWADMMSLGPPDGLFMTEMNKALKTIAAKKTEKPVIIRMMFGNIIGMPCNCSAVIKDLTNGLPEDSNIQLWVGSWRKKVSWNHAKLIAVDGKYLHTGGHNMWDGHYLQKSPVHDLSFELAGRVALDGHLFANEQWAYVQRKQSTILGKVVDKMPDGVFMPIPARVTVSEFPEGKAEIFPPQFQKSVLPSKTMKERDDVPLITIGRPGLMYRKARPSDDAIWMMLGSAQTIIRFALQDLGPVCVPKTKMPLPGLTWPKKTFDVLATVIWERGVDVEIILSNAGSIPNDLSLTEACYGNGWSCVDVAAEIISRIKKKYPEAEDKDLRKKVDENLRVSYLRQKMGNRYFDCNNKTTVGMHAKHFIVDDVCTYIGSQNLYLCDLAEWGVVVDHKKSTEKIKSEYWDPMWKASYKPEDCDVQKVMDGLDIDRHTQGQVTDSKALRASAAGVMPIKNTNYYDTESDSEGED